MPIQHTAPGRRGIGHFYGPKELKRPSNEGTRAAFAKYQEDLAAARAAASAVASHPQAVCSACGRAMAGKAKCCLRSHAVLVASPVVAEPAPVAVAVVPSKVPTLAPPAPKE